MFDIICVTNRTICQVNFLTRLKEIARCHPRAIILREKDLSPIQYEQLAKSVIEICLQEQVLCILHKFITAAKNIHTKALHLPFSALQQLDRNKIKNFDILGASCHSEEEALKAEDAGCNYIILGHIFATNCKKDLPPRGVDLLHHVCEKLHIPVYAIGGIGSNNIEAVRAAGASGACIMSGLMQCENVMSYLHDLHVKPNQKQKL